MSGKTSRLPVLFLGHGSPMNALADDSYTRALGALGERLGKPEAVLCVSAHWLTRGLWTTGSPKPRTIHDFGGFPEALYLEKYPAPGSPALAREVRALVGGEGGVDEGEWGLDHGAWTVLKFLYPKADVPVVQLSLDYGAPSRRHIETGSKLRALRDKGVLIVASGNIVHNLRRIDFSDDASPFDWAVEFDAWAKARLLARDLDALSDPHAVPSGRLAVPTSDHYDPMLVALGAGDERDALSWVREEIQNGSIAMRSFRLG